MNSASKKNNVWKIVKELKLKKENENIQYSGHQIARWGGFFYDKSWTTILNIIRIILLIVAGIVHLLLGILLDEELDLLEKMFLLNYLTLAITCLLMALPLIYNSKKMSLFFSIIETEFYQPKIKFSRKQLATKQKSNKFLTFFMKNVVFYYYFSLVANYLRRLATEGINLKTLPLQGWLPFEINSWYRYVTVSLYQLIASFSTVNTHIGMLFTFVIHCKLLCDEFEILCIYIQETFENNNSGEILEQFRRNSKREQTINTRMKYILSQHIKLLSYFDLLQDIYSIFLFVFSACAGIMVCTVVYIITDPNSTLMAIITGIGCIFLTEVVIIGFYCWFGQQLTNQCSKIRDVVYCIPWYMESISTQKSLLNVLTVCNRERIVKGGGLQEFSMKGLSELLQASFSYFNMLKAMR